MNLINNYTITNNQQKICDVNNSKPAFKKQTYQDPLMKWPLKGLAYSNELGAVVSGISPKLGTVLWVPALMYFGADIYDKYKNEDTTYMPSHKRGVKEAIFQTLASVILPTAAVTTGQRAFNEAARLTKTGLSLQSKESVFDRSLKFMQSKSLHSYVDNVDLYAKEFTNSIMTTAQDSKDKFQILPKFKKVLTVINPFKNNDSLGFANPEKLAEFSDKQARKLFEMRADLMQDKRPKGLSQKLFKKFQTLQDDYKKIYPANRYKGKAAKNILQDYHSSQIFKNKMIKTAGGLVALALLAKPIDKFVENIVIKKTVEPGINFVSNGYQNYSQARQAKKSKA